MHYADHNNPDRYDEIRGRAKKLLADIESLQRPVADDSEAYKIIKALQTEGTILVGLRDVIWMIERFSALPADLRCRADECRRLEKEYEEGRSPVHAARVAGKRLGYIHASEFVEEILRGA